VGGVENQKENEVTEDWLEELEKLMATATGRPWQVVMKRDDDGVTSYMIREHTHPSVVVERNQYWDEGYEPKTDADGYWLPDKNMDALPHRAGNAALIVAAINALPGLIESARRVEKLEASNADLKQALSSLVDRSTLSILARHQFEALLKGT
jgi:predicted transcriptional regulator